MSDSLEEPIPKRKRVAKACQNCRLMKSKCDGKLPSCSRCQGYDYCCVYSKARRRQRKALPETQQPTTSRNSPIPSSNSLKDAIGEYETLVQAIASTLPEAERTNIENSLVSVKTHVENALAEQRVSTLAPLQVIGTYQIQRSRGLIQSQRYLGEVSDVRFFNLVKKLFHGNDLGDRVDEGMDSYEQDDPIPSDAMSDLPLELPSNDLAEEYINIYLSTIHAAYPFIPRTTLVRMYKKIRDCGLNQDEDASWLSILYVIFAIGAYYTSFPGKTAAANSIHEQYFLHALSISNLETMPRSLSHVTFLLAQCFYLLAVCRTDSCWTTLGQAVRIGQSIGLHVEIDDFVSTTNQSPVKIELRRRLWYSIYVLDRLIALQLGRPPAIHDEDCHVPLPSRVDEADIDWEYDSLPSVVDKEPSSGDYFVSMISFSRIVGRVLRDLYNLSRKRLSPEELLSTVAIENQLSEWKHNLPRTLRFDLGHTFSKSTVFKRQRNMLAIKFHHLRALIYRPYLCLTRLRRLDEASIALLHSENHQVVQYENICVSEAQETARLLYNVVSEKDLVHDFPWWQMISCLICASSILLVASAFMKRDGLDAIMLSEDAETCLRVFEALSANSEGARIARDMMQRLQARGTRMRSPHEMNFLPGSMDATIAQESLDPFVTGFESSFFNSQDWPSEISDSMMWSAQVFSGIQNNSPGALL